MQQDLFGAETAAVKPKQPPFTASQRAIMRLLAEYGMITSKQAGIIVHAHRKPACYHCKTGTCPWLSSDGLEAMKRLMRRGLVKRARPGQWVRA